MYAAVIDRLTAAGFEHYEVSNFARPARRSRHNQAYWSGDGYFAAGPGAARYVDGIRETNHRSTTTLSPPRAGRRVPRRRTRTARPRSAGPRALGLLAPPHRRRLAARIHHPDRLLRSTS